jgi:hypothetical protein
MEIKRVKSLGFTGSRIGMTNEQLKMFAYLLGRLQPLEFHLGDCVGADAEAFNIGKMLRPEMTFVGHPPIDDKLRACLFYDVLWDEKEYLERNRDIVNCSQAVMAAPRKSSRGTRYTMNYALEQGVKLYVL